jgi:uncharacterized membrane protein
MLAIGGQAAAALLTAFLITVLELTEVVAVVYAMGAGARSLRPAGFGATAGVAAVGIPSLVLVVGVRFFQVGEFWLLSAGAIVLYAFGLFLLRSTVKTYFKEAKKRRGLTETGASHEEGLGHRSLFATAFSIAVIETVEAAIVLIPLGTTFPWEALAGFAVGGALLLTAGILLHERIRKLKVPPLKWVATSLLFTFAVFWTGEALGQPELGARFVWPNVGPLPPDIFLLPLFAVAFGLVGLAVSLRVRQKIARVPLVPVRPSNP